MGQRIAKKRFSIMSALKALFGEGSKGENVDDKFVEKFNEGLYELQEMLASRKSDVEYRQAIVQQASVKNYIKQPETQQTQPQQRNQARQGRE